MTCFAGADLLCITPQKSSSESSELDSSMLLTTCRSTLQHGHGCAKMEDTERCVFLSKTMHVTHIMR